jgi:hypothetical protein
MEQHIILFILGGIAILIFTALYLHHRGTVARKNRAIFDRIKENIRLEEELTQTRIEKKMLETLVKDRLNNKEKESEY